MPCKNELLSAFYSSMDRTQVKVETRLHGFDYMKKLSASAELVYSEWKNGVYKYKLTGLEPDFFDALLQEHLETKINLCVYFDKTSNNIFCFNLDSYHQNEKGLKTVARLLNENLKRFQIKPLILKSGHGYHFWCRLSAAAENEKLQTFMQALTDVTVFQAAAAGADISKLQCICYPRIRANDISIRLFGSKHTMTGKFNHVVASLGQEDSLLNEEDSWRYFEDYIKKNTIQVSFFDVALSCAVRLVSVIK